jgi:proline iminopeptidase
MFFERRWLICLCLALATLGAAKAQQATVEAPTSKATAAPQAASMLTGGIQLITIQTPKGPFKVWTKKVGHSPRIKVLLLHGGPGATHEYFEAMESFLPGAGIEFYYYDQLGSAFSDQPDDTSLVDLPRFVDEVEQVRQALKLDRSNFYLLGHSWGGILAIEYALKYPQQLKGLVVSNMVASIPEYNRYAHEVLMPAMDPVVLKQILALEQAGKYEDPQYEALLMDHFYVDHILRRPPDQWPDPVTRSFAKLNKKVYIPMQGPSEMGASGKLEQWDRLADLHKIRVPTLAIGARYDTMEPAQMQRIARSVQHGRYLYCPQGSHMAMYDDQQAYMRGLIKFLKDVDAKKF